MLFRYLAARRLLRKLVKEPKLPLTVRWTLRVTADINNIQCRISVGTLLTPAPVLFGIIAHEAGHYALGHCDEPTHTKLHLLAAYGEHSKLKQTYHSLEFAADAFAARAGYGAGLLKHLAKCPSTAQHKDYITHPSYFARILALRNAMFFNPTNGASIPHGDGI